MEHYGAKPTYMVTNTPWSPLSFLQRASYRLRTFGRGFEVDTGTGLAQRLKKRATKKAAKKRRLADLADLARAAEKMGLCCCKNKYCLNGCCCGTCWTLRAANSKYEPVTEDGPGCTSIDDLTVEPPSPQPSPGSNSDGWTWDAGFGYGFLE